MHTQLAANAGALKAGVWWLQWIRRFSHYLVTDSGFLPAKYSGFIIIGAIYLTGIFMTWRRARGFIKQEKVVLAE
ncbi:hypothetical protein ACVXHB_11285 [Escherichia coli]